MASATPSGQESAAGAARGALGSAPNMIGDQLGGGGSTIIVQPPCYNVQDPSIPIQNIISDFDDVFTFVPVDSQGQPIGSYGDSRANNFSPSAPLQFEIAPSQQYGTPIPGTTLSSTPVQAQQLSLTPSPNAPNIPPPSGSSVELTPVTSQGAPDTQYVHAIESSYLNEVEQQADAFVQQYELTHTDSLGRPVSGMFVWTGGQPNGMLTLQDWATLHEDVSPAGTSSLDTYWLTERSQFDVDNNAYFQPDPRIYCPPVIVVNVPSGPPGVAVGRTKMAENNSPLPRDRFFFDYNYYNDAFGGIVDAHRFSPGFEKTLLNGWMSFQLNVPTAVTVDSDRIADQTTDIENFEFGNLSCTFKSLLIRCPTYAAAIGVRVTAPTADDVAIGLPDGTPLVRIENESVYLAPYLGALWAPNDRFFMQGFVQWDVDASGSPVYTNDIFGSGLAKRGVLTDTTLQYVDVGCGYWIRQAACHCNRGPSIALTAEIHVNSELQRDDVIAFQNYIVGDLTNRDRDSLTNIVVGTHFSFPRTLVTVGYGIPLDDQDREFDGEIRLMVNRFFGRSTRLAQITRPGVL